MSPVRPVTCSIASTSLFKSLAPSRLPPHAFRSASPLLPRRCLRVSALRRQQAGQVILQEPNPHDVEPSIFEQATSEEEIREPRIWPQALFALLFGGAAFAWAAERTEWTTAQLQQKLAIYRTRTLSGRLFGGGQLESSSIDLAIARKAEQQLKVRTWLTDMRKRVTQPIYRGCALMGEYWATTLESRLTCVALVGAQAAVLVAWQIPRLQPFMTRNFLAWPIGMSRSYQLLTSTFSHKSFLHFTFNSLALVSFGTLTHDYLFSRHLLADAEPTATARFEFLAFFIGAGLFAGLTSHIYALRVRLPVLLKGMAAGTAPMTAPMLVPSLGASGAIWACFSLCALAYPNAHVALIILPFVPISIGAAALGTAAIDVAGLIRGWRFFDHAAHLGGGAFGVLYYLYGTEAFDRLRDRLPGPRNP